MAMTTAERVAKHYWSNKKEKACHICGAMFLTSSKRRYVCSDECAVKLREQKKDYVREVQPLYDCVCAMCGGSYQSIKPQLENNKYCSKRCKQKALRRFAHVCQECGSEFVGSRTAILCGRQCKEARSARVLAAAAKVRHAKAIERKAQADRAKREALCMGLRMWRAGKTFEQIAEATGYKAVSGFLLQSKVYKRISKRRLSESTWNKKEIECNAQSKTFKTETHFRIYAASELQKHFPRVMQEVSVPGSRRKIDIVVEDGLFRFGIELKNGNRTARMDQALGQALFKCAFLGGISPVVAVPDDVPIERLFLKGCEKLNVIAGTLSQVIEAISLKRCTPPPP
jgi:hypothetical protein